ncbi:TIGR03905 family TSCPD domain-containing protein [Prevotella sp.]|uniref:TIGR03905 family TSCPD domain-containing protein n=1 Tax=Prevotella sp. TaxID=59823 RepID=UPI00264A3EDA|nr:TIGR03905 family TSCPD domain-containing protein [Prevotella sp.]MDN5553037.1 TIGR03905 family TSCPD domain-containing protein [Prevotella sp.]
MSRHISYKPKGVCSRMINIDVDDNNIITNLEFVGGCDGNTHGIMALVKGMKVDDVKSILKGIACGTKATSCPDQLAIALDKLEKGE